MRSGFGKAYYDDGSQNYSGNWLEDKPDGVYLTIWNQNGSIRYQGGSQDLFINEY